jgi:hypothetical protein
VDQSVILTRRYLLSGAATAAALAGFDPMRAALAAESLDPLAASGLDDDGFMALSAVLTGHDRLNAFLGSALFQAMRDNGQADGLAGLYESLRAAAGNADAVSMVAAQPDHSATVQAVLRGWYVGLVTTQSGGIARIGYEDALMGDVVEDFLALRSYCGGEPHFWVELPELTEPIVVSEVTP